MEEKKINRTVSKTSVDSEVSIRSLERIPPQELDFQEFYGNEPTKVPFKRKPFDGLPPTSRDFNYYRGKGSDKAGESLSKMAYGTITRPWPSPGPCVTLKPFPSVQQVHESDTKLTISSSSGSSCSSSRSGSTSFPSCSSSSASSSCEWVPSSSLDSLGSSRRSTPTHVGPPLVHDSLPGHVDPVVQEGPPPAQLDSSSEAEAELGHLAYLARLAPIETFTESDTTGELEHSGQLDPPTQLGPPAKVDSPSKLNPPTQLDPPTSLSPSAKVDDSHLPPPWTDWDPSTLTPFQLKIIKEMKIGKEAGRARKKSKRAEERAAREARRAATKAENLKRNPSSSTSSDSSSSDSSRDTTDYEMCSSSSSSTTSSSSGSLTPSGSSTSLRSSSNTSSGFSSSTDSEPCVFSKVRSLISASEGSSPSSLESDEEDFETMYAQMVEDEFCYLVDLDMEPHKTTDPPKPKTTKPECGSTKKKDSNSKSGSKVKKGD